MLTTALGATLAPAESVTTRLPGADAMVTRATILPDFLPGSPAADAALAEASTAAATVRWMMRNARAMVMSGSSGVVRISARPTQTVTRSNRGWMLAGDTGVEIRTIRSVRRHDTPQMTVCNGLRDLHA